ncbi:hypothetical protein V6N11_033077 [Hibiscus sabdariffa]|uniref:Uncharacterized protein n=2 Tax=Hibiscus sabdariffa TaxID=183260 RepID=A0ABR1ZB93_9ROSI
MPLRRELRSIAVGVVSQDQENVIPPRGLPPPLPNPPVGATQAPPALAGLMVGSRYAGNNGVQFLLYIGSRDHLRQDCSLVAQEGQALVVVSTGVCCGCGFFENRKQYDVPRRVAHTVASQPESGGTFTLQSLSLYALMDSGSTHSYIHHEHAHLIFVSVKELDVGMRVVSSFG